MANSKMLIGLGIIAAGIVAAIYFFNSQNKTGSGDTGGSAGGSDGMTYTFNTASNIDDGNSGIPNNSSSGSFRSISQVNGVNNYVASVKDAGSAYGVPLVTVTTSSGESSTIAAAKDTYYPTVGIGFNSVGQGYSSNVPLKSIPTANTTAPAPVTASNNLKSSANVPSASTVYAGNQKSSALDTFTKKAYS